MANIWSADFETTTKEDDCRVWAWCCSNVYNIEKQTKIGNILDSFMEFTFQTGGIYFFHNLKFDGGFILDWLFRQGYTHRKPKTNKWGTVTKAEQLKAGEFTSLISDMGAWYTLEVVSKDGIKVVFKDSLKLIPLPIEKIPAAFGLEESKLTIDYNEEREIGHELTKEEEDYIKADVCIAAKAIRYMLEHGEKKLTAASNALADYKERIGKKLFQRYFPELEYATDYDVRQSYKGGWSYVNPAIKDIPVGCGKVYDVNSMYPWAMKYCLLPYGKPYFFEGEPEENPIYKLFVVQFVAEFTLLPGHYPSIQLKNNPSYAENEYIVQSDGPTLLTLTSVDINLMFFNYEVKVLKWYGGYYFAGKVGLFTEYVDYWYKVKTDSKREGNKGMEQIAKLKLNSLYGKFGMKLEGKSKIPVWDKEKQMVKYKVSEKEDRRGVYVPVASFITSYCRDKIIRGAVLCGKRFAYADTDSLHVLGLEPIEGLDIDEFRLGAFKEESTFDRARFVRQKTYIEVKAVEGGEDELEIKCAGMPKDMKKTVKEKDFYGGAVFPIGPGSPYAPKLSPKTVSGGVILREMPFQIKK